MRYRSRASASGGRQALCTRDQGSGCRVANCSNRDGFLRCKTKTFRRLLSVRSCLIRSVRDRRLISTTCRPSAWAVGSRSPTYYAGGDPSRCFGFRLALLRSCEVASVLSSGRQTCGLEPRVNASRRHLSRCSYPICFFSERLSGSLSVFRRNNLPPCRTPKGYDDILVVVEVS